LLGTLHRYMGKTAVRSILKFKKKSSSEITGIKTGMVTSSPQKELGIAPIIDIDSEIQRDLEWK
jgi:hypothetical protein